MLVITELDRSEVLGTCVSRTMTALRGLMLLSIILLGLQVSAQETKSYQDVVRERSAKILQSVTFKDDAQQVRVLDIVAGQYVALNAIHEKYDALFAATKDSSLSKDVVAQQRNQIGEGRKKDLLLLHQQFLQKLSAELSSDAIEFIKDGMTYRVCPITYTAFLDMIPSLKEEEKVQILNWLVEAREEAMDQGSSNKKHEVFGKYKGRINNYLAARGYDLKKEREGWQERLKAKG